MKRLLNQPLDIHLVGDAQGIVRLTVLGELDVATAGMLRARIRDLCDARCAVVLDLSALGFIDASGLRAVIESVAQGRQAGWDLEVDQCLSASVARLLELTSAAGYVWPGAGVGSQASGAGCQRPGCTAARPERRGRASSGRPPRGWRPPSRPRI
jgi:anti-anti-sigma factor